MNAIRTFIDSPPFLIGWAILMIPCLAIVVLDLRHGNAHLGSLMKVVWTLTVFYSGPLGLAIYWLTGRKEIADDHLWRRGFRSVAHCYSGCGLGEITGVLIAAGLLGGGNATLIVTTFSFAYLFGLALTVGPLMQDGTGFGAALKDGLISETPSILVMEVVAIGTDLWLAGQAGMGDVRFWTSLIVSLTIGLLAAYPVNYLLVRFGVKEGMMDPRMTDMG